MAKPSISVFFPCYNDRNTIVDLVRKADALLSEDRYLYEITVVDDGSQDDSRAILIRLQKEIKKLRLIFHKKNRGYGGALKTGLSKARYDLVFYTDGDGQYDVFELGLMIPLLTGDIDVVNGIKMSRQDPWYRVTLGNLYNFFVRNIFNIEIVDTDCDFRLIRNKRLKEITLRSNSGAICVELVRKLQDVGATFRQVSVHHYPRSFGKSQFFNVNRIFSTWIELIKLRMELWGYGS